MHQGRYDDLSFDDYSVEDIFARHYTTHSEAIGEVLQNTADITIAHGRLKNIVSKALKGQPSQQREQIFDLDRGLQGVVDRQRDQPRISNSAEAKTAVLIASAVTAGA